jgi:diguanylate cyclase (GGDEF)-like protein
MLWQRHRQTNLDRIAVLEATTATVLRSTADEGAVREAAGAAHKLAGSLGTFGFAEGSGAALEAEYLLRQPVIDGRLLAEAVTALRAAVQDESDVSTPASDRASSQSVMSYPDSAVRVVSLDADLVSRLTVEAEAIGLCFVSVTTMPTVESLTVDRSVVIVDDGPTSTWTHSDMLDSVSTLAKQAMVIVLTDRDAFEDRAAFAKAGVACVVPRSQGSRQTVSFLAEALARRTSAQYTVLSLNIGSGLERSLGRALAGPDCRVDHCAGGSELWDALDQSGADLVIVGFAGSQLSGPELCRMIRSHPQWQHLPVVIMGGRSASQLDVSFASGADDYLNIALSPHDLGVRLRRHLERWRLFETRSERDPVTGTGNRAATERSLDRILRLARRDDEPFALALVSIDHFEELRARDGAAACDAALRQLGAGLLSSFQADGIVGRWSEDGFAVGLHGVSRSEASERITRELESLAADGFLTTSGGLAYFTSSAGVASAPLDGTTVVSLERVCEAALRRAAVAEHTVVVSGERPVRYESDVVDVVLVEDDDSMADVIQHALELRQYRFVRFSDGAEAARELGGGRVRAKIVLLDVGLPSLDGFGVLQALRNSGILEETRVIMLTARSSEAEMLRAIGLGATEHITKPFSMPVLLARLEQTHVGAVA